MSEIECDCGEGVFRPVAKPGRTAMWRPGFFVEIPADLVIRTCDACGEELWNKKLIERIARVVRAQEDR